MGFSLKPPRLRRYKDIARLILKYGRSDLFKGVDLDFGDAAPADPSPAAAAKAEELAADFEAMGPTFIKLAQLLSSRSDLLPPATIDALSRLRDKVEPVDGAQILKIVEDELGARVSRVFPEFDVVPIAAASLGQVHRARLRDGREVVVKVQRPDVRRQVQEDMDSLARIADLLDRHAEFARRYQIRNMVADFRRSLALELDYRQEASHMVTLGENLADFERIVVPAPVEDLTTSRVLTMEFIRGFKISDLPPADRACIDGVGLADELFRAYLKQILVDGFVHADPHPGNVFVTPQGRLALLDLGMIMRLSASLQDRLVALMLAIAEGRGDEASAAVLQLVEVDQTVDRGAFNRRLNDIVGRFQGAQLRDLDLGRVLVHISRAAVNCGFLLPAEIGMIGQTLLKLDAVGRHLAPEFQTDEAIRRHALQVMRSRVFKGQSAGKLFRTAVEMKEFATQLPGRVNRILDVVADNRLRIEVDALDETRLMAGLQKIANRISVGLVLAALIVAAALLMRVETSFRIFGYPGLAMLLFGGAAAGILMFIFNIVFRDVSTSTSKLESRRRKSGRRAA